VNQAAYHGVDFSGGRRHDRKIRIASLLPGARATVRGSISHSGLVEAIARSAEEGRNHFWLLDSAFGLPVELLEIHGIEPRWEAAARWLASFSDAREWRSACRERSRKELRRSTDRIAHTPLSPANLRMFRQTWHCIATVLLPLSERPEIVIVPLEVRPDGATALERRVWVGEGCPSSTLRRADWPNRGYKGPAEKNRALRRDLIERLKREEGIPVPPEVEVEAFEDPEGDVLDALLLLPAARRFAQSDPAEIAAREPRAAVEGWVFE